ncbi:hypothetical protein Ddc_05440 [Ditylenchus destructor]|nr:hypothetical protein Ddc_05440 [Ditylenchus destructor]
MTRCRVPQTPERFEDAVGPLHNYSCVEEPAASTEKLRNMLMQEKAQLGTGLSGLGSLPQEPGPLLLMNRRRRKGVLPTTSNAISVRTERETSHMEKRSLRQHNRAAFQFCRFGSETNEQSKEGVKVKLGGVKVAPATGKRVGRKLKSVGDDFAAFRR